MQGMKLSEQVQYLPPSSHAVLPPPFKRHATKESALSTSFPGASSHRFAGCSSTKPIVATHSSFLSLLGPNPTVKCIAKDPKGESFAHEAGVWVEDTKSVWFTSNLFDAGSNGSLKAKRVQTSTLDPSTGKVTPIDLGKDVTSGNGGCPYGKYVLLCEQGAGEDHPSAFVAIDPLDPTRRYTILNNFHGRPFNSLNDAILLPPPPHLASAKSAPGEHALPGSPPPGWTLWFTDPTYGHEQSFRPPPQLPSQVYVFNPQTGHVRAVADDFDHPNGICFSPDGKTCYVTDTSHINGTGVLDPHKEATIYAFDVVWPDTDNTDIDAAGPSLRNKRLFAFADTGVPDGIKCDTQGNVYSGCGDGVHVWNKHGTLIGKFVLGFADNNPGAQCANFNFIPGGRMVCFSEDRIYLVEGLAVEGDLLVEQSCRAH